MSCIQTEGAGASHRHSSEGRTSTAAVRVQGSTGPSAGTQCCTYMYSAVKISVHPKVNKTPLDTKTELVTVLNCTSFELNPRNSIEFNPEYVVVCMYFVNLCTINSCLHLTALSPILQWINSSHTHSATPVLNGERVAAPPKACAPFVTATPASLATHGRVSLAEPGSAQLGPAQLGPSRRLRAPVAPQ